MAREGKKKIKKGNRKKQKGIVITLGRKKDK